jgi:hypothetical protein
VLRERVIELVDHRGSRPAEDVLAVPLAPAVAEVD